MSVSTNIESICDKIKSTKVTERRRASELFLIVLKNEKTIEYLNKGGERLWTMVLCSVHNFLRKEADKAVQDNRKKGTPIKVDGSIFYDTVQVIIREGRDYNVQEILKCITDCLEDEELKECYCVHYLNTLQGIMLPKEIVRGYMKPKDWDVMFSHLKKRFVMNDSKPDWKLLKDNLETISLFFKYGPLHGFCPDLLREQFSFVTQLCQEITTNSPRRIQTSIMEIVYNFCFHTAKDSRISCCKLGEDTFSYLIALYEIQNPKRDGLKLQLIKYLLLQVVLHNPKGVSGDHPGAYAFSWEKWFQCLKFIHRKFKEDISYLTKLHSNYDNPLFVSIHKHRKYLHKDFLRLFAEVIRQITHNFDRNERQSLREESKKPKLISPVMEIIESIEQMHHWPWINVLCTLIEMYPDVMNDQSFIQLLQVLSKLQIDCKDNTVAHHIYYCLSLLEEIQGNFQLCDNSDVKNTWTVIRDTALRTFGLNQNDPQLHRLLQKLILHTDNLNPDSILNTFTSQVLDVTENNLRTLETVFNVFSMSHNSSMNQHLIDWIFTKNNPEDPWFLSNIITAKILVGLMARKWPFSVEHVDVKQSRNDAYLDDLADICLKTVFEDTISKCSDTKKSSSLGSKKIVLLDHSLCTYMVTSLSTLVDNINECRNENKQLLRLFNAIALIKNIISYLLHFKLMDLSDLYQNNVFLALIKPLFDNVTNGLEKIISSKKLDDLKITAVNDCITCLHNMFLNDFHELFEALFREHIPTRLLKNIVSLLDCDTKDEENNFKDFKIPMHNLKITVVKTLVAYSSGDRSFSENENHMFFALAEFDYSLDEYSNCDLVLTFFRTIKDCRDKVLNSSRIDVMLNLLYQLCEAKYKHYAIATEVLEFMDDLFPHVAKTGSDDSRRKSLQILRIFYTERNNYGPRFLVNLANCVGRLYQIDPECRFAKWDGTNVILKLPEFLCHQYQEVRFATLENLVMFFKISSSRRYWADYHLQELMFDNICLKCESIFHVRGSLIGERLIDETVTRSAVVLHALSSIFGISTLWQEKCLFALFKIVHERQLESFPKALNMISKSLGIKNSITLLEKYLPGLLRLWLEDGQKFDEFPISLFNCDNKISFYSKYLCDVMPFLLEHDAGYLDAISEYTNESIVDILEKCFPNICMRIITSDLTNLGQNVFESNNLGIFMLQHFDEEKFKSIFLGRIDRILLNLLSTVKDEKDFTNKFDMSIMFTRSSEPSLTIDNLRKIFNLMEDLLCPGESLVTFLYTSHVDKLQRLMMQLVMNIFDTIAIADRLRIFHQYTFIVDAILENLNLSNAKNYFIRDICYVLLRFIKNYTKYPVLAKLALFYFKTCLKHLVLYSDILGKHFVHIVTTLVDNVLEIKDAAISDLSLKLLKFLVIDNVKRFEEIVKHMDNFPEVPVLRELFELQSNLKYGDRETNLKDEIFNFVYFGSISKDCQSKLETLARLQLHLLCETRQLKNLYSQLSDLNGFSEYCENSLIHQLISELVEFSCLEDKNISSQALKCLGELGPSDLMTLVVKPEKRLSYVNSTPFEFFSGQIVSLLNMYLVDNDVQLIPPSAEILYNVLNTKEGRKVIETNEDFGYGTITSEYLVPFITLKRPKSCVLKVNADQLVLKIDSEQLWSPDAPVEYYEWIRVLVCNILETVTDSYIPQLINICRLKVEFCEILLPSLVYLLLSLNNNKINTVITRQINSFFEKHWITMRESNVSGNNFIVTNRKAVQVMMNVVHFVRVNKSNMKLKKDMEELDLDYLKIAKAAQHCSAYFTSLLYIELWCHSKREMIDDRDTSFKNSTLDFILETESEDISLAVVNILRSSYKAIGDHDSLQGCGSSHLMNTQLQIEYYKDTGMWDQVLLLNNLQISRGISNAKESLMESLKHSGLYEMSLFCKEPEDEPDYECLWRLSDWSRPDIKVNEKSEHMTFEEQMEKYKYFALKNVHERDVLGVLEHLKKARELIKEKLKHTSLESSTNLYHILTYLQGFNEIENFLNAEYLPDLKLVFNKWNRQDEINKNNFAYIEPIITQRIIMLNDYVSDPKSQHIEFLKNNLVEQSLKLSERARLENKTHIGIRALSLLQKLPNLSVDDKTRINLEDAQLCKATNNKLKGRKILNQIAGDANIEPKLRSLALKLTGEWCVESYSEHADTIIREYFLASILLCEDGAVKSDALTKSIVNTYNTLARFADREYQQVTAHIQSDIFQKKVKNMQKSQATANELSRRKSLNSDENKARIFHNKQGSIDQAEIENIRREKDNFLKIALRFYLRNLFHSEDNNLQIFRVMSLFLENRSSDFVIELIKEHIPKIPSYKFLIILPQLIPHIAHTATEDYFSQQANLIIHRCANTHPHHTLPIIMALANSHKDLEYNRSKTKVTTNEERILVAKNMIKSLKKNPKLVDIIAKLEAASDALIELAYVSEKSDSKRINIPRRCKIMNIKNFSTIPVFTDTIPIDKTEKYDNIIGIQSYEKYYDLVGGLNAPKRIICIGTDGKPREQLVKGQDDLRQDAVMQQVFNIMNSLLSINKQTWDLKIRTYKVVPLSMRSGVLEWAKNTMPIGAYLTGDENNIGAHQLYRPQDKSAAYCRKVIAEAAKRKPEDRLRVFNNVCENFKPVFHKFFEDNFLHPTVWYERRRACIHSVATSSMCGYILGIGDRHVSNILIDKTTAEVVHIDFGIAFEQGRTLPTPETVPFRLTRDFVDAMGVSGVEGAFRRSCEKTMLVLRENSQTIMAILGVLLYDPLYSWTVSAAEASRRQCGSSDDVTYGTLPQTSQIDNSVNNTAERALLRLNAKLRGIAEGTPMSVEHQVGVLIHQAMDPANLSKLFNGWQAYL